MNEEKRAAIYCRLSKDDEQIGDSVSIETQKMLLTGYCKNQGLEIIDIYIDDGYSGLNFNRPSFKRLIDDLENKKFDIVITKDLSRLGRDYIQTGYYIDVYFATKHIRYIAVNDGIDTLQENNDIAPFKNILNDMYAKDLSRKVKSAKRQRAQNGLFISAQPPYGYKVDPYNKNKLIIDPEPALVVKTIFELAHSGSNYSEISRILERRKIISPSAYKALIGDTRFIKYATEDRMYKWAYQTIKSIICNPVYVGDMVNHKVETVNYKTKERIRIPSEQQIIVSNTHEPIIDRKMFEAINSSSKRRKSNHNYDNIFKGLIFCAECGEEMQLIAKSLKRATKPMFRCPKHATTPYACKHNHFIYYDDLLHEIEKNVSLQIYRFIDSSMYDDLCKSIMHEILTRVKETEKNKLQKELHVINKSIREKYKAMSASSNSLELTSLLSTQSRIMKKLTSTFDDSSKFTKVDINNVKVNIKKLLQEIQINQQVLKLLIERIEIGHLEKNELGVTIQNIGIYYRFNKFFIESVRTL